MADSTHDRSLAALLALEDDEPRSSAGERRASNSQSLPSLDERIELFLRAVHGAKDLYTAKERARARNRILNAMATDLAGETDDVNFASATAPAQLKHVNTSSLKPKVRSFAGMLRDALLLPLTMPLLAGGPMRMVTASLVTLVFAGAGWSATWFYAARSADTAIASWIDGEMKSGRNYECGSRTVSGFPLRIEMHCIDPKATLALGQSTLVVNAKELRTTASLLQPSVLNTEITGPLSVTEPGQSAQYVGNWALAQTVVHGLSPSPQQISFVVDGLQLYRVSQNNMEPVLAGDRLDFNARRNPKSAAGAPTFDMTAQFAGASIANGGPILSQPFAAEISAVLHDVNNATPKILATRLREWQSGGGRLEVTTAKIQQGDGVATAAGTIALNKNGRIDGSLRVATSGPYQQLAQSYIRDGQPGTAERDRLAQSVLGGARIQSRSINPSQRNERDLQQESAERQRQQASPGQEPLSKGDANKIHVTPNGPGLQSGSAFELPIRVIDGAIYLGTNRLADIPTLF